VGADPGAGVGCESVGAPLGFALGFPPRRTGEAAAPLVCPPEVVAGLFGSVPFGAVPAGATASTAMLVPPDA
jgi:hypothetical protein